MFAGKTDEFGDYAFEFPDDDDTEIYTVKISGGINRSTGLPFEGVLEHTEYDESDAEEELLITGTLSQIDYPSLDFDGNYATIYFSSKPRFINNTNEALSDGSNYLFTNVEEQQNFINIGNTTESNVIQIEDDGSFPVYEQDETSNIYKLTFKYVNKGEADSLFKGSGKVNGLINTLITIDILEENATDFNAPDVDVDDTREQAVTPATTITSAITKKDVLASSDVSNLPEFWQKVSFFNPVVYLISGFRWSFFGSSDVSIEISIVAILIFASICLLTIYQIFKTGYRIKQ